MADVLIVDDDEDLVDVLSEFLISEGHRVRSAKNGLKGLQSVEHRHPEVVILDVDMPVLTGPQMAMRMFLEDCGMEKIPILLLSGTADLRELAAVIGTPYFLVKPCSLDELTDMLDRILGEETAPCPPNGFSSVPRAVGVNK